MQAHQEGNLALIEEVVARVEGAQAVLELYAGSGNLSLAIAEAQHMRSKLSSDGEECSPSLCCVEGNERALASLQALAKERDLKGVQTLMRDLRTPPHALLQSFIEGGFDHLVLDPPRAGAKELIEALCLLNEELNEQNAQAKPLPITYISCHPAALARDLQTLGSAGWRMRQARLFHLFPHTGHAEVCVTLSRDI
jgi:23S rRNA (uracil1939-C5)-methyltransferase